MKGIPTSIEYVGELHRSVCMVSDVFCHSKHWQLGYLDMLPNRTGYVFVDIALLTLNSPLFSSCVMLPAIGVRA